MLSDHPGTRRYQEVISIEPGQRYQGAVHYLFPGGCVTYRFDFRSDEQAPAAGRGQPGPRLRDQDALVRRSTTTPTAGSRSTCPQGRASVSRACPMMGKVLTLPRHPGDVLRLVAGLAILLGCIATVRPDDVGVLEETCSGWPTTSTALFPAFWVVMQAGNVLAVGVAAAQVAATRRFWLAANLAITGIGVWLAARWIKDQVGRGRPVDLLDNVHLRGHHDSGLGFVSGHAAVAVAIATLIVPYLPRRVRWVALVVAALAASRACTSARTRRWTWSAGRPPAGRLAADPPPAGRPGAGRRLRRRPRPCASRAEVTGVTPWAGATARCSARFQAVGPDGEQLFAKLIPRERRDEDLLYRVWRMLAPRWPQGAGSGPPLQQVEREAYLGLLAARPGQHPTGGPGRAVRQRVSQAAQRLIPGGLLEQADPAAVGDATLKAAWRSAASPPPGGHAHGDLGRHSVVVDATGGPGWSTGPRHRGRPRAPAPGRPGRAPHQPGRAVRPRPPLRPAPPTPREPLAAALAAATPAALTRTTREELGDYPTLWDDLARRVAPPGPAARRRGQASIFWPFPMITTPPSETTNRSRSWSSRRRSGRLRGPARSCRRWRCGPLRPADVDVVHQHRPLDQGAGVIRPGDRIERCTVPPDTTTPAETIESSACPVRPSPFSNTNWP